MKCAKGHPKELVLHFICDEIFGKVWACKWHSQSHILGIIIMTKNRPWRTEKDVTEMKVAVVVWVWDCTSLNLDDCAKVSKKKNMNAREVAKIKV
jgi:hypothetical protein